MKKTAGRPSQKAIDTGSAYAKLPAMPKRSSSSKGSDPNVAAFRAVQHVIAMSEGGVAPEKNPAAVALGRLGGLKGGKARASKLSAKRKSAIAKKAALARWSRARS
jgi:hypothetical protein